VRPAGPILEQWDDTAHWGGRTAPAADIEASHLEALEAHTPGSQVGQGRLEALNLERHLGRFPRWRSRRAEEMELGRPADVAQAAGALLDRLEPELVAIESARPLEVMSSPPARPVGATRRAEISTSAPEPRSSTISPSRRSATAVGMPHPSEALTAASGTASRLASS
jgi:hypothetical protein